MSDTNQTIAGFYAAAQRADFARDFALRVLSINPGDSSTVTFDDTDLVYIKTAILPERTIQNVPVPYMGMLYNIPGSVLYSGSDSWPLEFYADAKSNIRMLYEKWSRDVFDDATSTGNYFTPRATSVITLAQLDNNLNMITTYNLVGCSVRSVGALNYSIAEGTGQTISFTATTSYHFWTRTSP